MTGYHTPVLLKECIDGLKIDPDGIYVDLTFGSGGHSREILKKIKGGKLVAFDQDEQVKQNIISDDRFVFVQGNFRFFKNFLLYLGIKKVHGILADLGVSSHHFDEAERGFSFRFDGALDMRMNTKSPLTAAVLLNTYSEEQLADVFYLYGELHNSRKIARTIVNARSSAPFDQIFPFFPREPLTDQFVFQVRQEAPVRPV